MIVGALQMNVVKNNKVANLNTIDKELNCDVDLVVLPELFSTGYFFETVSQLREIAEEIPEGYTTKRLIDIARKVNCQLIGAIVEKEADKLYITAIAVGPSGFIGKHRKRHLTNDEAQNYTPGTESKAFDINGCKVGAIVCFEGWFPESARELMLQGAQILCHSVLTCQQRTLDIMRVRAIENKAFVVIANSISTENYNNQEITFRGDSRIIDYNGNILVTAGQEQKLITAEVNEKETIHKDLEDCVDLIAEVRKQPYL